MTAAQRLLLALLGIASLGGIAALLFTPDADDGGPAPVVPKGPSAPATAPRPASSGGAKLTTPLRQQGDRPTLSDGKTGLEVIVVDAAGAPLPEALVELTRGDGARYEGHGTLAWDDATPGTWHLEVRADGLLPYRREVTVVEGERTRVGVRLAAEIELVGTVTDPFGHALEIPVFALPEGRQHPRNSAEARELAGSASNRNGDFRLVLREEGKVRFSFGPAGTAEFTSPPFDVHLAGPTKIEAVLDHGSLLEVFLEDPSDALLGGTAVLRVAVLQAPRDPAERQAQRAERQAQRAEQPRDARGSPRERSTRRDGERRDRQRDRRRDDEADVLDELGYADDGEQDPGAVEVGKAVPVVPDPVVVAPREKAWKELAVVSLGTDGKAEIPDLPPGVDLRLAFLRKNDRFESDQTFVLLEGRRSTARFSMPPKRSDEQIAAEPTGHFPLFVTSELGPNKNKPTGVRLVE